MFDEKDYRYAVLGIIMDEKKKVMSELRVEIFVAAAQSTNAEACLMPFPPSFFDGNQKKKDVQLLREHITLFPPLSDLTEETKLPRLTWELLYWILTNPLTIENVETSQESLTEWKTETGLDLRMVPRRGLFLFKVNNPYPNTGFVEGKGKHGSLFGFHGSKFENYHSILHRGLVSALNKRSVHGVGSYLSSDYGTSYRHTTNVPAWSGSPFGGELKCLAICEVVDHPSIIKKEVGSGIQYFVVQKDELIQLSHILLFSTPRLPRRNETFKSIIQRFRT